VTNISICNECKGKGKYKVFNAYDPNFSETVICEYCDGEGTLSDQKVFAARPKKAVKDEDEWKN
jgi:DnaJ-class molecular chaperone